MFVPHELLITIFKAIMKEYAPHRNASTFSINFSLHGSMMFSHENT
jgi:hypothetical protein